MKVPSFVRGGVTLTFVLAACTMSLGQIDDPPDLLECSTSDPNAFGGPEDFDPDTITDVITVDSDIVIADLQVTVDIDHEFPSEIVARLLAPDGSEVMLHDREDSFAFEGINLIYWDYGRVNRGPYECECLMQTVDEDGLVATLEGLSADGDWELECSDVLDDLDFIYGTLEGWCLGFFEEAPTEQIEDLECTQADGEITLEWTNPVAYDEINIYVDGLWWQALDGDETTVTVGPFVFGSTVEVMVEGVLLVNDRHAPFPCSLEIVTSPPITCTINADQTVLVEWTNIDAGYDELLIFADDVLLESLELEETEYTTEAFDVLENVEICVRAYLGGVLLVGPGCCQFTVLEEPDVEVCEEGLTEIFSAVNDYVGTASITDDFIVDRVEAYVDIYSEYTTTESLDIQIHSPLGTSIQLMPARFGGSGGPGLNSYFGDLGIGFGAASYTCKCLMRARGPGSFADFYGQGAEGDWDIEFTAAPFIFVLPFELRDWCLRFFQCGDEIPRDLTCEEDGADVSLEWTNSGVYDSVDVFRDRGLIATLWGDATTFVDEDAPYGAHTYGVIGRVDDPLCVQAPATCKIYRSGTRVCETPETLYEPGSWSSTEELDFDEGITVRRFNASFDFTVTNRTTQFLELTSPAGTTLLIQTGQLDDPEDAFVLSEDLRVRNLYSDDLEELLGEASVIHPRAIHLDAFDGEPAEGEWSLFVRIYARNGPLVNVTLNEWCLEVFPGCDVDAPEDLTCTDTDGVVELSWINEDSYDAIEVWLDGRRIAEIAGDATTYEHLTALPGYLEYEVVGTVDGCGNASAPCVFEFGLSETCSEPDAEVAPGSTLESTVEILDSGSVVEAEVSIDLEFDDDYGRDWVVQIQAPDGTTVDLLNSQAATRELDELVVTFSDKAPERANNDASLDWWWMECDCRVHPIHEDLELLRGADMEGDWTLIVEASESSEDGHLNSWCLRLFGDCELSAPTGLVSFDSDSGVELAWEEPVPFDQVDVVREGSIVGTLDDDSAYFVDEDLPPGFYKYWLEAEDSDCRVRTGSIVVSHDTVLACSDEAVVATGRWYSSQVEFDEDVVVGDLEVFIGSEGRMRDATLVSASGTSVQLVDYIDASEGPVSITVSNHGRPFDSSRASDGIRMLPQAPGHLEDFFGHTIFAGDRWILNVRTSGYAVINELCIEVAGATITPLEPPTGNDFLRGDADGNGTVLPILDALFLLEWGFQNGPEPTCLDSVDVDDDGTLLPILDALFLLQYGFVMGETPADPGPDTCGEDPTFDDIGCETPSVGCG